MTRLILLLLLLSSSLPTVGLAATYYVRPASDWNGTALSYGTEDGTSWANAFKGFADIIGLAAGDTVCLPGSDEPFTDGLILDTATSGTITSPITYVGCAATRPLLWSSSNLTGDRSFNASRVLVTGDATYEWVSMGNDFYKKKIGVRAIQLYEDTTWLSPIASGTSSEATIMATLTPGQWTNRDNGDSTFRIIYRATTSAKNPANTTIRSNNVPKDAVGGGLILVDRLHIVVRGIDIRGWNTRFASSHPLRIMRTSNVLIDDVSIVESNDCASIEAYDSATANDITFLNVTFERNLGTCVRLNPNSFDPQLLALKMQRITFEGGSYSYTKGYLYNGTTLVSNDGDGIGIGWNGGLIKDVVIRNIRADGNGNYGVFSGTADPYYEMTNLSIIGATMDGNGRGCFSEGNDMEVAGTLLIAGLVCTNSGLGAGIPTISPALSFKGIASASIPTTTRNVIVVNSTFVGNSNKQRIHFNTSAATSYAFSNLVFEANPGDVADDRGDFHSNGLAVTQTTFDHIWLNSLPNTARPFARLGVANTNYLYNSGSDLTDFVTATGATNVTINTDPLLISTVDFRTKPNSPLRGAAGHNSYCRDARDRVCSPDHPDMGAYQTSSGDLR